MDTNGCLVLEQIRYLYEDALENFLILDKKGKIVSATQPQTLGYNAIDELIGKNIFSLSDSENHKALIRLFRNRLSNKRKFEMLELMLNLPGGEKIWYELRALQFIGNDNNLFILVLVRNISKRKNLENQLKKLNQNLESVIEQKTHAMQEAISDLESFSYSVSHDLRAPLRAIKGYSQILTEELKDSVNIDVVTSIDRINKNIDKMGKLISDILSFSGIGRVELKKVPVDFGVVFSEKYSELKQFEVNRSIKFTITQKVSEIYFDTVMAKLLAQNLLSNAIKYTSRNELAEIEFGVLHKGNHIVFYLKDNGVGFDEKFKDKLFAVFQRLHSEKEFPGTGVGLAIVKRIVKKHDGTIWGEGKVNEGSTFYMSFPKQIICHGKN